MSHSESEISEDRSALLLSSMAKGSPTSNCINGHSFHTMEVLSTPSTMLHHQLLTPLPPGYMTAMPYHNLVIPVPDNFNGPINTNVSPSIEPNGRDLPVHGKLAHHVTIIFMAIVVLVPVVAVMVVVVRSGVGVMKVTVVMAVVAMVNRFLIYFMIAPTFD